MPGHPNRLVFDGAGDLFVAVDSGIDNNNLTIIEIMPDGMQTTFASKLDNFLQMRDAPLGLAFLPIPTLQAAIGGGSFQLTVTMPSPYYTTIVQSSADLVNWCDVCTNTPPFTFTDSLAVSFRFYRAVLDTNFY